MSFSVQNSYSDYIPPITPSPQPQPPKAKKPKTHYREYCAGCMSSTPCVRHSEETSDDESDEEECTGPVCPVRVKGPDIAVTGGMSMIVGQSVVRGDSHHGLRDMGIVSVHGGSDCL